MHREVGGVGAITVLPNLNRVCASAELDHEAILILRTFPSLTVDGDRRIARLDAQRNGAEIRLAAFGADRWRLRSTRGWTIRARRGFCCPPRRPGWCDRPCRLGLACAQRFHRVF